MPIELAMPVLRCAGLPYLAPRMHEPEIQASCTMALMASKVPRISAAALGALERRLHEHRLPIEEQAFLAARLETYRKAAALASRCGCGRPNCCVG